MNVPTPHIAAQKDQIAKTVLMPGDPLRSEFIAKTFLTDPVLVNDIRGVHGYTGTYKGTPVTVMASGMGQPSIGIYSYELYNFYDVENIIRVGTCGSYHPDLHVRDVIIAMGACTDSNFAAQYRLPGTFCPLADFGLVKKADEVATKMGVHHMVGNIFSSDHFYEDDNSGMTWAKMGVLGVEMEAAALYCNAARAGKKALCICTVSNSFTHPEEDTTPEERQNSLTNMIEIALALA